MADTTVMSGSVPIAVRDSGGSAPPLLLLHGAGANLAAMRMLADQLGTRHRVVSVDLRGHGYSGDGPWRWEEVLADLDAVVTQLRLTAPAVVGLSLGGMVAACWAGARADCPAVVNLDGNPTPDRPGQLPGMDQDEAARELARLHAAFAGMAEALATPMSAEQVASALTGQRQVAAAYGPAGEPLVEAFQRGLATRGGATLLRPRPELLVELQAAMRSLDLTERYRHARCRVLHVLATEDLPEQRPFHELYAAYRGYLQERFAAVAAEGSPLRVHPLAGASHAMLAERPVELAELIVGFLSDG